MTTDDMRRAHPATQTARVCLQQAAPDAAPQRGPTPDALRTQPTHGESPRVDMGATPASSPRHPTRAQPNKKSPTGRARQEVVTCLPRCTLSVSQAPQLSKESRSTRSAPRYWLVPTVVVLNHPVTRPPHVRLNLVVGLAAPSTTAPVMDTSTTVNHHGIKDGVGEANVFLKPFQISLACAHSGNVCS